MLPKASRTETNQALIDSIMHTLLEQEDRRYDNWVSLLCRQNQGLQREPVVGFLYEGLYYKPAEVEVPLNIKKVPLHMTLWGDMDCFLKDKRVLELDRAQIKQTLFQLLYPCSNEQEKRDALPECLVTTIEQFRGMSRQSEEAWSIQDNPRALRQYLKVMPRIEMYVAVRLVY